MDLIADPLHASTGCEGQKIEAPKEKRHAITVGLYEGGAQCVPRYGVTGELCEELIAFGAVAIEIGEDASFPDQRLRLLPRHA
jgi:hypothetical protein